MENRVGKILILLAALALALVGGALVGGGIVYAINQVEELLPTTQEAGIDPGYGVVIASVDPEGPAAVAGLVRGDILLEIDGEPFDNHAALIRTVRDMDPGLQIEVEVLHGDERRTWPVTVTERSGQGYVGVAPCAAPILELPQGAEPGWLAPPGGAVVIEVIAGSPAELAGLETGDLISTVNGQELTADVVLADLIGDLEPGDTVTLEIIRPGTPGTETRDIQVELGQHPDALGKAYLGIRYSSAPILAPFADGLPVDPMHEFDLDDVPEGHWDDFGFGEDRFAFPPEFVQSGAVIVRVVEGTPAEEAGLRVEEIITGIDGEPIESPGDLGETIARHDPGDEIVLTVARQGDEEEHEVRVTLGKHPEDAGAAYLGVVLGAYLHIEGFQNGRPLPGSEFYHRDRPYGVPPEAWPHHERFPFDLPELPLDLDELFEGEFEEHFHFEFPPLDDGCQGEPGCGDSNS